MSMHIHIETEFYGCERIYQSTILILSVHNARIVHDELVAPGIFCCVRKGSSSKPDVLGKKA